MNPVSKFLLANSPVWVQNLGISAFGYKWHKRRFGGVFNHEYKQVKERETYTKQQWQDYQTMELRKLLVHAFTNVPFYTEKYKEAGISENDLSRFELSDLHRLPILTKDDLRQYGTTSLLAKNLEEGAEFFTSSGSTGMPAKIMLSTHMHQRWQALFEARIRNWAGVTHKDARGMIGGRIVSPNHKPPFHRYNFVEKQTYFSIYDISESNAIHYYNAIKNNGVKYMTGYAISNYILVTLFEKLGFQPIPLKAVITSSEKLTPQMAETMSRFYGCGVYDSYSGIEACGMISQHKDGKLYSSPDAGIMELIDFEGKPLETGMGRSIWTGLLNYNQPLIRYEIGDMIEMDENQNSPSGLAMPIVKEIVGRTDDVIKTQDGKYIASFNRFFADLKNIRQTQVIQESETALTIKIAVTDAFTEQGEAELLNSIKLRVSFDTITIEKVPAIEVGKNGKFKAVISKLKK